MAEIQRLYLIVQVLMTFQSGCYFFNKENISAWQSGVILLALLLRFCFLIADLVKIYFRTTTHAIVNAGVFTCE